jgi:Tol biopolymer transport system component
MISLRSTTLALLTALAIGSCGRAGTPTAVTITSPPLSPSQMSSNTPSTLPSLTSKATLPNSVLPICQSPIDIELGEITLTFAAEWDGDDEIYIIQADGSNLTQLTFNTSGDVSPTWSPDGQQIAYIVEAYTKPSLYISNPDGSGGRIAPSSLEVSSIEAVWSPGGDKMAFRNMGDLYVVDVETGEVVNLTRAIDFAVGMPRFSHDGSMLAFRANVLGEIPQFRLFVVNVDGTGLRELSFPQGDVYEFSWHPLEEQILFYGTSQAEGTRLYAASPDGTIIDLGIDGHYRPPLPALSPDGTMFVYIMRSSSPPLEPGGFPLTLDILHVATVGLDVDIVLLQPPEDPNDEFYISNTIWAPDSRHIAYTIPSESGGFGEVDLFVLDICDGSSTLVVEAIDTYSTPSWRPLP